MWGFERCETVSIAESAQCSLVRCLTQLLSRDQTSLYSKIDIFFPVDGKGDYVGSSSFHQTMYWRKTAASDLNIDTLTEERGQISTFDIRVPADVIRQNTKAEGKLSLTADLGPPLNSYIC